MRRLAILARIWTVRLGFAAGRLLPLRPIVVLATAHVPAIGGNLAAIRDELARRYPAIPVVALVHDARPGIRGLVRGALNSVVAGWYLARARVFVTDSHFTPLYVIERRPGTLVAQTWHATGAIKRIGYAVVGKTFGADEVLIERIRLHRNYDLCLASSEAAARQFMEAFRQPRELFVTELGIPRTDPLMDPARAAAAPAAVRRRYGIPADRRLVLFAPTFRGTSLARARDPGNLDLAALAGSLAADHTILVRLHPAVRAALDPTATPPGFVVDVSDHPDVNELLLAADVLVTDYSSLPFEYALLGRQMAFFAPDVAAYEAERGFFLDYRAEVPGPICTTAAELAAWLRAGRFDEDAVRRFARTWIEVADGHATERFVERVVLPGLAGRRPELGRAAEPAQGDGR